LFHPYGYVVFDLRPVYMEFWLCSRRFIHSASFDSHGAAGQQRVVCDVADGLRTCEHLNGAQVVRSNLHFGYFGLSLASVG
jgi:hypothetical protein